MTGFEGKPEGGGKPAGGAERPLGGAGSPLGGAVPGAVPGGGGKLVGACAICFGCSAAAG